MVFRKSRIG